MTNSKIRKIVYASAIAAVYTALSLALAPISFGAVQFRVAEAMTIFAVFNPAAIWGLTLGCIITNFIGVVAGANFGMIDVVAGSAATLIAAVCTWLLRKYKIKGLPVFSTLPPVLINAVVVGAELTLIIGSSGTLASYEFLGFAASVAAGQLGACTVVGLILYVALEKTKAANALRQL